MSGIFQRISLIFRAKTDKALDKLEDPRQTLDYSYQRQLELLQKVRRGVADVATSRKRVELQATQLNTQADKLTQQAQRALEVGREDLAREALTRRSGLQQQLTDLQAQHAQLQGEEEKLTRASQRLQAKVDAFRTRKETIKATYSAAEAQTRINEAFSGIGEEMGDVGLAIQRAEDKTAQMQARAGAIDELLASGALDDPSGMAKDDITLELEQLASTSDVENELARMKAAISAGPGAAPQAIEAQQAPNGDQQQPPYQQQPPQQLPPVHPQQGAGEGAPGESAPGYQPPPNYQPDPQTQQSQGDLR
jgi:phage shock protein A